MKYRNLYLFCLVVQSIGKQAILCIDVSKLPGGPTGVIVEVVLLHHLEHGVAPALEEGSPVAFDLAGRNVGKLTNLSSNSSHLSFPLIHTHCLPVGQVVTVTKSRKIKHFSENFSILRDRVSRYLMTLVPILVHEAVVCITLEMD